ncbi:hypothetical protein [Kitasatospora cathayae]|uniref:Uncharacterized protein n=1 Tax=Kitasatospora cathayae TaxID=3004092 RepID=A0ABY7Q5A8_9ACTN|nr:hypothetical protein [Kitasatospora sp. HUAS 3-15]WBP87712.1 hypothetical protein O1G21_18925 [Kitasatospora sp. HUAS 3-15]
MAAKAGGARTLSEHRAVRRQAAATFNPLDDYDVEVSVRVAGSGILREWPACTCGADHCPDKGVALSDAPPALPGSQIGGGYGQLVDSLSESADQSAVNGCRVCGMFDRMATVFREAPEELRDMRALADIEEKRQLHAPNCEGAW